VTAVENGTVVGVMQGNSGYTSMLVQHGEGYTSVYAQLGDALVRKGQSVQSGTVLGRLAEKDEKVMELEFELWRNGTAVDPERYILFK
jgi:lipoprotein NlpD